MLVLALFLLLAAMGAVATIVELRRDAHAAAATRESYDSRMPSH